MSRLPDISREIVSRRGRSRLKTCLCAKVISLFGIARVELIDISLTGAKLRFASDHRLVEGMRQGETVVLQWDRFEAMGQVIWIDGDRFGIEFDELVRPAALIATRDRNDELQLEGGRLAESRILAQNWAKGVSC